MHFFASVYVAMQIHSFLSTDVIDVSAAGAEAQHMFPVAVKML